MTDQTQEDPSKQSRIPKMTKQQKLAALMILLGPEVSPYLFKNFPDEEVEQVSSEMSKIELLSWQEQQDILDEFSNVALHAGTSIQGGMPLVRQTLEESVGLFRAADILGRISPVPTASVAMKEIVDMESRQLFNLIKKEQDQTIALVVSYLTREKAAQVITFLGSEKSVNVLERLATLSPTSTDVVEKVVEVILAKAGSAPPRVLSKTGGLKSAADVLNALDKNLSKTLLFNLEEQNAELGASIKNKMFTFEDLTSVDSGDLQKVLREIDIRELAVALKTGSDKLKGVLLSCISSRAAESVEEEISFLGPLKLSEIDGAKTRIIEVVRRLESEEEIDLSSSR